MVCPYRFVQALVMKYEVLVLLPGGHEVVGDNMEHLAIDLSLKGVDGTSVTVSSDSPDVNSHYEQHKPSKPSSRTRPKSGPQTHAGQPSE